MGPILGALAGGLGSAIGGVISGEYGKQSDIRNLKHQEKWNNINHQFSQDTFKYQQQQDQLMQLREDNAVQRKVSDLKAAGLNKNIALGGQGAQAQGGGSKPADPNVSHQNVDAEANAMQGLSSGLGQMGSDLTQAGISKLQSKTQKDIADKQNLVQLMLQEQQHGQERSEGSYTREHERSMQQHQFQHDVTLNETDFQNQMTLNKDNDDWLRQQVRNSQTQEHQIRAATQILENDLQIFSDTNLPSTASGNIANAIFAANSGVQKANGVVDALRENISGFRNLPPEKKQQIWSIVRGVAATRGIILPQSPPGTHVPSASQATGSEQPHPQNQDPRHNLPGRNRAISSQQAYRRTQ